MKVYNLNQVIKIIKLSKIMIQVMKWREMILSKKRKQKKKNKLNKKIKIKRKVKIMAKKNQNKKKKFKL